MIIVTGAGGFIGSYLVKELIDRGRQVYPAGLSQGACWVPVNYFDITYPAQFPLPTNDIEAIVHCAALLMIDGHFPKEYFRVNTLGTYNVLEYARKINTKFIYLQTHSDINLSNKIFVNENTKKQYGGSPEATAFITSKIAASNMVESYCNTGKIKSGIILRLANIRGVGSQDTRYNCVFHQFIEKAKKGDPIELWGALETRRDLIYIKDVVDAIIAALDHAPSGTYNIGTGVGLTIEQEAQAIVNVFCNENAMSPLVYRKDIEEIRKNTCVFNCLKAFIGFGWKAKYTYEQGLRDMKSIMEGLEE